MPKSEREETLSALVYWLLNHSLSLFECSAPLRHRESSLQCSTTSSWMRLYNRTMRLLEVAQYVIYVVHGV